MWAVGPNLLPAHKDGNKGRDHGIHHVGNLCLLRDAAFAIRRWRNQSHRKKSQLHCFGRSCLLRRQFKAWLQGEWSALSPPFGTETGLQRGKELNHNQILSMTAEETQQVISGGTLFSILNKLLSLFLNCILLRETRFYSLMHKTEVRAHGLLYLCKMKGQRSFSGLVLLFFKSKKDTFATKGTIKVTVSNLNWQVFFKEV